MRHLLVALAVLMGLTLNLSGVAASSSHRLISPTSPDLGERGGARGTSEPTATGFDFVPTNVSLPPGGTNTLDLRLREAVDLAAYEVQIAYNPAVIAIDRVDRLLGTVSQPSPDRTWSSLPASSDPNVTFVELAPGLITFGAYSFGNPNSGLDGNVLLARLHVRAVGTGSSALHFNMTLVSNPDAQGSQPPGVDGSVSIDTGGSACVTGRVQLQGRTDYTGTSVSAAGLSTQTAADGQFNLCGLPSGARTVRATRPGYLSREANIVLGTLAYSLSNVTLLGGDINGDDRVDIFDLVLVGGAYGAAASVRPAADVNGNGTIDIFDLTLVGINYGRPGPQTWNKGAGIKTEAEGLKTEDGKRGVSLSVVQPEKVAAGEEFEVAVRLADGQAVAGADVTLHFDPSQVEILGLAKTGEVWDETQVYVVRNAVDKAGGVRFAATALGGPLRAGAGALFTLRARALADGPPSVSLDLTELVDAQGQKLKSR